MEKIVNQLSNNIYVGENNETIIETIEKNDINISFCGYVNGLEEVAMRRSCKKGDLYVLDDGKIILYIDNYIPKVYLKKELYEYIKMLNSKIKNELNRLKEEQVEIKDEILLLKKENDNMRKQISNDDRIKTSNPY